MENQIKKRMIGSVIVGVVLGIAGCGSSDSSTDKRAGDLDKSFNTTGIVTNGGGAGGDGFDSGNDVAIDSGGKIVVAGSSTNPFGNTDMMLWRYNSDGTLDTTFNGTGFVLHNNAAGGDGNDVATRMLIDANGKILLSGFSDSATDTDMVLWRFDANGSLDTTFNGKGFVTSDSAAGGNGRDTGFGIASDAGGRILVTGLSHNGSDFDMALWRYNSDGTPDTTFNGTGFVTSNGAAGGVGRDAGGAVIVDHKGRIVVTGQSDNGTGMEMTLWRYDSNGSLDTTFNGTGIVSSTGSADKSGENMGFDIVEDNAGRYVIVGESSNGRDRDMIIWRYNSDGSPDTTFNSKGWVTNTTGAGGDGEDIGTGVAIDDRSRIVVTGRSISSANNYDMALWRYNNDGTPDTTFKGGSVFNNSAAGGNGHDGGKAVVLDAAGRIVVAGYSEKHHEDVLANKGPIIRTDFMDMAIWRYLP